MWPLRSVPGIQEKWLKIFHLSKRQVSFIYLLKNVSDFLCMLVWTFSLVSIATLIVEKALCCDKSRMRIEWCCCEKCRLKIRFRFGHRRMNQRYLLVNGIGKNWRQCDFMEYTVMIYENVHGSVVINVFTILLSSSFPPAHF